VAELETTVFLSDNEISKVSRKMRSIRPSYWDADAAEEVEISPDMEAFLILLPASIKTSMAEYIRKATEFEGDRSDRDDLLLEFVTDDLSQLDETIAESEDTITEFSAFLAGFDPGKFGDVEEVTTLMNDLGLGFPERLSYKDRITFFATQASVVQGRILKGSFWGGFDSSDRRKQFRSWLRAILAYAG